MMNPCVVELSAGGCKTPRRRNDEGRSSVLRKNRHRGGQAHPRLGPSKTGPRSRTGLSAGTQKALAAFPANAFCAVEAKNLAWRGPVEGGRPSKTVADLQPFLCADETTDITGMKKYRVSRLKDALEKLDLYRQCLLGPQYRRAHLREGDARTLLNKGEVELYTPAKYLEAVREVASPSRRPAALGSVVDAFDDAQVAFCRTA